MTNQFIGRALLGALAFGAAQASAAVLFEQDFNGETLASITGTGVNQFGTISQGTGSDPHSFAVVSDTLEVKNAVDTSYPSATASGSNFASLPGATYFELTFTTAPVATVSSGNTAGSVFLRAGGRELRLDLRVDTSGALPRVTPRAEGGQTLAGFTAPVEIRIIGNSSAASYTYTAPNGTTQTLDANQWDVWAGTTSSSLAVPMTATASADQLQIQIPGWSTANGTVSIDNLQLAVPEPTASVAMLGLAALALRRRRMQAAH